MTENVLYEYSVSSDAYLERARSLLLENRAASLFYAAFELRCFVEARQNLLLDAQREYARSVPKHWRIGAQGKALEAIFESNKIQHVAFSFEGERIFDAYHVPVSKDLRKRSEKLGDLLHAQGEWRDSSDDWWKATRSDLVKIYEMAWLCDQGNLLSPMFLHNGTTVGKMMLRVGDATGERLRSILNEGATGTLSVDYLEQFPEEWRLGIQDLNWS